MRNAVECFRCVEGDCVNLSAVVQRTLDNFGQQFQLNLCRSMTSEAKLLRGKLGTDSPQQFLLDETFNQLRCGV